MKTLLPVLFTAALAVFPFTPSYAALDAKLVSADARWLIHVDFNLLRESEIGRELLAIAAKTHSTSTDGPVSIDFQKVLATIGKATAYGANLAPDEKLIDGTLIIEGTPDLRKIAEGYVAQTMLSAPNDITEIKDLPFEAYSIPGDVFVGFPKEQIILVSKVKSQLARAHELYRGKGSSMAQASSSALRELIPQSRDSFLVAASTVPGETMTGEGGPQARLIKMAQAASLSLGEKNQQTFTTIKLVADSNDTADKLQKIVQGLVAMASLAHSDNKDLEQFMKSVTVDRQNLAVQLNAFYSSKGLIGMIQNMQQHQERVAQQVETDGPGKTIATWKADQDLGSDQPNEKIFTVREMTSVPLVAGAIIRLTGNMDGGEHARIDYLEIQPVDGSSPSLKFEAEYMKLSRYQVEKSPAASGGKLILTRDRNAVAELQFPAATGNYHLRLHYLDETDGKSTFTVSVEEPTAEANE